MVKREKFWQGRLRNQDVYMPLTGFEANYFLALEN